MFMDNLQEDNDKYSNFLSSNTIAIYILDHSTLYR